MEEKQGRQAINWRRQRRRVSPVCWLRVLESQPWRLGRSCPVGREGRELQRLSKKPRQSGKVRQNRETILRLLRKVREGKKCAFKFTTQKSGKQRQRQTDL